MTEARCSSVASHRRQTRASASPTKRPGPTLWPLPSKSRLRANLADSPLTLKLPRAVLDQQAGAPYQRLLQIGDDVIDGLDADREADQIFANTHPLAVLRRDVAMRAHPRVEHHAVNVAKRSGRHDRAQGVHELEHILLLSAAQFKADHAAVLPLWQ